MSAVLSFPAVDAMQGPTGRHFIDGGECQCGEHIKPSDLVDANFDRKRIHTGGGLYLYVHVEGGRVTYRGCRPMMRTLGGISIDMTGRGEWEAVPELPNHIRIVGTVEKVYRPTK